MGQSQNDDSFKNMDMPQNDFGLEDVNQALDAAANDGTADLLSLIHISLLRVSVKI